MEITAKELKSLYYNNSNKYVCQYLDISNPTLISLLNDAGIEQKGKGGGMTTIREKKIRLVK